MPKTAVGLFENASLAREAASEIEKLGFPPNEIRVEGEPLDFAVSGVMGIPHIEFQVALTRELMRIGAAKSEAEAFVRGVARGGALVLATGPDETKVDAAATVMNHHGAADVEEVTGSEPHLPTGNRADDVSPVRARSIQAGRVTYPGGGGARGFVW